MANQQGLSPYLSALEVGAFSIGTAIGWGSLVVTCSSYLAKAGIAGSVAGIVLGGIVMLAIGRCYCYLIAEYPEAGGSYAFVRKQFGHDYGFLAAWFLVLTYLAVFWANATSLPLFMRYFTGNVFRFGYLYTLFGYEVYAGEALLVIAGIAIAATLCFLSRKTIARLMVVLIAIIIAGLVVCVGASALGYENTRFILRPEFLDDSSIISQITHIAYLSPWAFIGFESVSHYSEELKFNNTKLRRVMAGSVVVITILYVLVLLLSVSAYPSVYDSWFEYIQDLGNLSGLEALPAFYAANYYMGDTGVMILGGVLFCLVASSLLGNLVAISRLFHSLSKQGIIPSKLGNVNARSIPSKALVAVAVLSLVVPFIGRTAIGWIVDVTTIGATVVYAFVCAAAIKLAKANESRFVLTCGHVGLVAMLFISLNLLIPALLFTGSMETESYFLFTLWSILGIFYFHFVLKHDEQSRYGRYMVVWIALLALILFTSLDWMHNVGLEAANTTIESVRSYVREHPELPEGAPKYEIKAQSDAEAKFIEGEVDSLHRKNTYTNMVFIALFTTAIGILVNNYSLIRKRADKTEEELGFTKSIAYRDALTGVRNKRSFDDYEQDIREQLKSGTTSEFAIVVFDVNDLKYVNDTFGHKAGDEHIRFACTLICKLYKHSPVFRIGGDEFVAVLTGDDYASREALLGQHDRLAELHAKKGEVVVSAGMCTYDPELHQTPRDVFKTADERMYERKKELKAYKAQTR